MSKEYFLGLDLGTNSVGWAAADENYEVIKYKNKSLWGVRLFDEAQTANKRRIFRSNRRRNKRAKARQKLLKIIFEEEIAKKDPKFYTRLRESFYFAEDKKDLDFDKNTLFNDDNYKDKDYHKEFPTIWHLRKALMEHKKKYDIRLYFLAINHIIKNRGHFLLEGEIEVDFDNFSEVYNELVLAAEHLVEISEMNEEKVKEKLFEKKIGLLDRKKQLKEILYVDDGLDEEDGFKGRMELAGLLVGSEVDLAKIFTIEEDKLSFSFKKNGAEEKIEELRSVLSAEDFDLLLTAKKVYDFVLLKNLINNSKSLSEAMVKNYEQHKKDLKKLQKIFREHEHIYKELFKSKKSAESYNAYIGKAINDKGKAILIGQDEFNKVILKRLEEINCKNKDILEKAKEGLLLPKQKGQAKGTIPMQLHRNELKLILENLGKDFESFNKKTDEPEEYNTKIKKILSIHSFRVPYYCGPLVKRKYDNNNELVSGGKSEFSWGDEEINELVYPWNFKELVDLDKRAQNFIRRMTNECSYLLQEEVLPKSSLLYQKFLVLNELNNLKINGVRNENVGLKQKIFETVFVGEDRLTGNFSLAKLEKKLREKKDIEENDKLGGLTEGKYLPRLSTHHQMIKYLDLNYEKKYSKNQLEELVEILTVVGEDKGMCVRRIKEILDVSEEKAREVAKIKCNDWGRLSGRLLNGIRVEIDGVEMSIIEALYETNKNFMELLGFGFQEKIDEFNLPKKPVNRKVEHEDVKKLYCSPAVKRTIWQTLKVIAEVKKTLKLAPKKIFIEVTRENEDDETKKRKEKMRTRRKEQLTEALKGNKELLSELAKFDDYDLQSKKLYLYFMQHGKCAYSGARIRIEEFDQYDIDHIYPRSLTKDDSITRNLVLVKKELNKEKGNDYPINSGWQNKMNGVWDLWLKTESITREKYERLIRRTALTEEELGRFIARQLVETSQSVKAVAELLKVIYPETKIVTVKAGQVSDFRKIMAREKRVEGKNLSVWKRPEFVKVRELNDLHHAKDAYLNIVVGNVMNETFTSDPVKWVKSRKGEKYSINPIVLFRESKIYHRKSDGGETDKPEVKGWNFEQTIEKVANTMRKNNILVSRMVKTKSGEISDLQPVKKGLSKFPLKKDKRLLEMDKYGGFNSLKGAHFALIEYADEKGEKKRRITPVMIVDRGKEEEALKKRYKDVKILVPKIFYGSLMEINGERMVLAKIGGEGMLGFYHAGQAVIENELAAYLKKVLKVVNKIQMMKKKKKEYLAREWDRVHKEGNEKLYDALREEMEKLNKISVFDKKAKEFVEIREKFKQLEIEKQCLFLLEMIKMLKCNKMTADFSELLARSNSIGGSRLMFSVDIKYDVYLIEQSVTGLYEKKVNLRTI